MKTHTLSLIFAMLFFSPAFAQVVVVVHPSMNENISSDDIARLYTGRSSVLQPVNLKESDAKRAQFDEKAVGRSSAQLKAYWSKLVFTGKGTPPPELNSDDEVIQFVSSNEYGIGYIDAANVTDKVKVIMTLN
ncbi:phosphate ABC transporter substrate-binding protein [Arsukibacterium sp.]|uniref:phosphate ABC transporter substrate-binding protein n=1 Tax=Arsukibacterium sp. TaxID=1977258 RepID=UPI002FDB3DFD